MKINAGDGFKPAGSWLTVTIAAVGYLGDLRVAATASHIGGKGTVCLKDGKRFGEFITDIWSGAGADIGFIKLDDDVEFGTNGEFKEIGVPRVGKFICKRGHGILNWGERCGTVTKVTDTLIGGTWLQMPGDSGSPVYWGNQIFGVASRIFQPEGLAVATRLDSTEFELYRG